MKKYEEWPRIIIIVVGTKIILICRFRFCAPTGGHNGVVSVPPQNARTTPFCIVAALASCLTHPHIRSIILKSTQLSAPIPCCTVSLIIIIIITIRRAHEYYTHPRHCCRKRAWGRRRRTYDDDDEVRRQVSSTIYCEPMLCGACLKGILICSPPDYVYFCRATAAAREIFVSALERRPCTK